MFRLPGFGICDPEPWSWLRNHQKQNAYLDGFCFVHCAVELDLRPPHAIDLPDRRVGLWGPVVVDRPGRHFFRFT